MTDVSSFVAALCNAIKSQKAFPAFPEGLSLDDAYALLPDLVNGVTGADIAGVKAGLTNPDLRALFGLEESLIGHQNR